MQRLTHRHVSRTSLRPRVRRMGGNERTEYRGAKEKRRLSRREGRLAIGGDGGWTMGGSGMMARSSLGVPILHRGRRDHAAEGTWEVQRGGSVVPAS
jgi:hypothetical protein